jgi:hypothetical protein
MGDWKTAFEEENGGAARPGSGDKGKTWREIDRPRGEPRAVLMGEKASSLSERKGRQVALWLSDEMFQRIGDQAPTKQKTIVALLEYALDRLDKEKKSLEYLK